MKDNFSTQSETYALFRPTYPKEVFGFLFSLINHNELAWDAATGNGQVASILSERFETVIATDISEKQLSHAEQKPNIIYKIEQAENSSCQNQSLDLITVAQAIHWFDFEKFYAEVTRTLKPDGFFAAIGYGIFQADKETMQVISHFYNDILDGYWDEERKFVDEEYRTIPFPFNEIQAPLFKSDYLWSEEQVVGFLSSWSGVQHYIRKNKSNPLDLIRHDLQRVWKDPKQISFPVFTRVGKLK